MAETPLQRASPVIAECDLLRAGPPLCRWVLRGAPEAMRAAADALGLAPPEGPCRASAAADRALLWLGPDERLLLLEIEVAAPLSGDVEHALQTLPHAMVDVSQRQVALRARGPHAAAALAAGCPLDLDPQAFPVGMCTRTVLAKSEIVLWRTASESFHIEVWRSFAKYVSHFIAEAARACSLPT
jgi:sarcosine oxidase subunit gamma